MNRTEEKNNNPSYWFETYGCEMNKAESSGLENILALEGFTEAPGPDKADLVILNTCSVRITAENRIWGRLGFYKNLKKDHSFTLVVIGCMAERLKTKLLETAPVVDYVISNFSKGDLKGIFSQTLLKKKGFISSDTDEYSFFNYHNKKGNFKAFVPIMHGCSNFCSYCIVPYVRGPEKSRNPLDILEEIERLEGEGVKEITLLGQNVNSYDSNWKNRNIQFPELLELITDKVKSIAWIRFLTSHPKDFSDRLIETIRGSEKLCKFIHLPVQHGSDKILKRMNRKYSNEYYLSLIGKIKNRMPEIALSTDILVGFPGEEEKDFIETLELLKTVRYSEAFMYFYNPREGTASVNFDNPVSEELKHKRLSMVIELQQKITREEKIKALSTSTTVLAESFSKKNKELLLGRTERNEMAVFKGPEDLLGKFVKINLNSLEGNTFKGSIVKE